MQFIDVFEKVELKKSDIISFGSHYGVEFPIDFIYPPSDRKFNVSVYNKDNIQKDIKEDIVIVPLDKVDYDLNEAAGQLLLTAGTERNVVIFDDSPLLFSVRLIQLMKTYHRRNVKKIITDIFVDEDTPIGHIVNECLWFENKDPEDEDLKLKDYSGVIKIYGANIHPVKHELYIKLHKFFEEDLKGTTPAGKNNICIGISLGRHDQLVNPIYNDQQGLSILNNQCVILGAY